MIRGEAPGKMDTQCFTNGTPSWGGLDHLEMDFRMVTVVPDLFPINAETLRTPTTPPPNPKKSMQGPKYGSFQLKLAQSLR